MAGTLGRQAPPVNPFRCLGERGCSVLEALRADPRSFSFIQAVRVLAQTAGRGAPLREFMRSRLRVRPHLSLGFAATDIQDLEAMPGGDILYRLTVNMLGLYGPSSPLPTFYTEELLDEAGEDRSVCRDFLDILNDTFFNLLFGAVWVRNRIPIRTLEDGDAEMIDRLFALSGLALPEVREEVSEPYALLRACGLLTQFPRSAAGLRALLSDQFGVPVHVEQCVLRRAVIPEDQRSYLGQSACLGEMSWLGSEVETMDGKIGLAMGPLSASRFADLAPGGAEHKRLRGLVRFYCTEPLDFDLRLELTPAELQGAQLGAVKWGRLGLDTWLSPAPGHSGRAFFPGEERSSF